MIFVGLLITVVPEVATADKTNTALQRQFFEDQINCIEGLGSGSFKFLQFDLNSFYCCPMLEAACR
uniref:Secreted protein n=1 Tax=Solanum lycopersicum TaxID=4081 RepID=A0A3Q7EKY4_SOLLC